LATTAVVAIADEEGKRIWGKKMNRFGQALAMGAKSLLLHKLRSALAVLGITIGVSAVIWLVAMGEGVSDQAQKQIRDLGADNIILRSVKPPQKPDTQQQGLFVRYGLLRDDFDRLVATIPTIRRATPFREISKRARHGENTAEVRLIGCTPAYFSMNQLRVARGRSLADLDGARLDNVCVLGSEAARKLFGHEEPLGQAVQLDQDFYVVVGVTRERMPSEKVASALSGHDFNLDVCIPLETLRARIGDQVLTSKTGSVEGEVVELSQVTLTVSSVSEVESTAGAVRQVLEKFHKEPDYVMVVPRQLLRQAEVFQLMFRVLSVLIAGISLVVGGIGIMNIMLATVTERTREIGIRRALGARRSDIVRQFLSETLVLSTSGGVLGVATALLCGPSIQAVHWSLKTSFPAIVQELPASIRELEPRIAPWSVIVAFSVSVLVGVVFGLYPARRAALLDPIEALRHE
jgi:putative ABC transport system permease protein